MTRFKRIPFASPMLPLLMLAVCLFAAAPLTAANTAGGLPRTMVDQVKDATVYVVCDFTIAGRKAKASGSGWLIDAKNGYVITNDHVIHTGTVRHPDPETGQMMSFNQQLVTCTVIFNSGKENALSITGTVLVSDPKVDLAVVKLSDVSKLTAVKPQKMGDSDKLTELDGLWAFGFPLGQNLQTNSKGPEISILQGKVTGLARDEDGMLENIRSDFQVTHGNSGGPVVNDKGEVVGIVVAGYGDFGEVKVSIPVNKVRTLLYNRVTSTNIEPRFLPKAGGTVRITATLEKTTEAPGKIDVKVSGPDASKLVSLTRSKESTADKLIFSGEMEVKANEKTAVKDRKWTVQLQPASAQGNKGALINLHVWDESFKADIEKLEKKAREVARSRGEDVPGDEPAKGDPAKTNPTVNPRPNRPKEDPDVLRPE